MCCSLSPPPHLPKGYAIPPTHLLMLTFAGGSAPNSAPLRLMVPIHERNWSLRCHAVARLVFSGASSSPSSPSRIPPPREPADTFKLPVIPFPRSLPLAAFSTFTVLHTYLHTATLPSRLPSPESRPGEDDDASFDTDADSEDEDADDEEIDSDEEVEEEDPLLVLQQQQEQYQGLYSMCRAFGIDDSDPIYEWMHMAAAAAAADAERWCFGGGAAVGERAALFAWSREVAAGAPVDAEDVTSSWSHLPTPPPG